MEFQIKTFEFMRINLFWKNMFYVLKWLNYFFNCVNISLVCLCVCVKC